jgi:hypothetical protein
MGNCLVEGVAWDAAGTRGLGSVLDGSFIVKGPFIEHS